MLMELDYTGTHPKVIPFARGRRCVEVEQGLRQLGIPKPVHEFLVQTTKGRTYIFYARHPYIFDFVVDTNITGYMTMNLPHYKHGRLVNKPFWYSGRVYTARSYDKDE